MDPQFRNILDILKRRELGFYTYPHRSCAAIIRSIFNDKSNNVFDCCYQESSPKPIYVVENRMYFQDLSICKALHGQHKPIIKYKKPIIKQKISDFHTIHAVALPFAPEPKEEYRNTFYILTQEASLCIQNLETGEQVRPSIFISNDWQCKYRHISFQNENDRIYVESNLHPRKTYAPNVVYSVIAFKILPLKLIGSVDFTTEIFGKDLKLIDFHNEVLVTLHGSNTENYRACIYDFDAVLSPENKLFAAKLGEYCPWLGGGIVGSHPFGIPLNYKIQKLPPVLFRIGCTSDSISFSPLPLVFILTAPKKSGLFEVYDVFTHKLIGTVGSIRNTVEKFFDLEEDEIFIDIRGRIVYRNNNDILVYSIEKHDDEETKKECLRGRPNKRLKFNFKLELPLEEDKTTKECSENVERRVLPHRKSKMKMEEQAAYLAWTSTRINTCHYNNILETFLVLADIPTQAGTGTMLIYDSISGKLMCHFHVCFIIKEENIYNVHMFYENIFIVERNMQHLQYRIYAYQLSRDQEEIE